MVAADGSGTLSVVHIDAIDWGRLTISSFDGREFVELSDGTWIERGATHEGSVRYWGGGCHGGQINLTPLYQLRDGRWENIRTGERSALDVRYKCSGAKLDAC